MKRLPAIYPSYWRGLCYEEGGQSLVELALGAVVAAFLLLIGADFGRVFFSTVAVSNATRVGAEYAMDYQVAARVGPDAATQAVVDRVIAEADPFVNLDPAEVAVSAPWTPSTSSGDSQVTVTVQHPFDPLTPWIQGFFPGGQIVINHTTTLRHNFIGP